MKSESSKHTQFSTGSDIDVHECPKCGAEMDITDCDYDRSQFDYDSEPEYKLLYAALFCPNCNYKTSTGYNPADIEPERE